MKKLFIIVLIGFTLPSYGMWSTVTSMFESPKYYTPWGEPCTEPWPDTPKPSEKTIPKALEKEIVATIKNNSLSTQDKIIFIQNALNKGANINEKINDKPLLAFAIETLDLELVTFLIEQCKADYNATITLPLIVNNNLGPKHIGRYMVDSYTKKLVPRKDSHDFTMIEFAADQEKNDLITNSNDLIKKYKITHYLCALSDIHFSRSALDILDAIDIIWIEKFLTEHTDYPRMLLPLNRVLLHGQTMVATCLAKNIITAQDIFESIVIMLNSDAWPYEHALQKYFNAIVTTKANLDALQTLIIQVLELIDTQPLLFKETKFKLKSHIIFDSVKKHMRFNQNTLKLACNDAKLGDFKLAKTLLKNTYEITRDTLPMSEIIDLVGHALQWKKNDIILDIINNLPLLHKDIKLMIARYNTISLALDEKHLALSKNIMSNRKAAEIAEIVKTHENLMEMLTLTLYYTMPQQMSLIIDESKYLPTFKNSTSEEIFLLGLVNSLKLKLRAAELEKMLRMHGKDLEIQTWRQPLKGYSYSCFSSMLLAQLWNLCPHDQPDRLLSGSEQDCLSALPQDIEPLQRTEKPYISTNLCRIGSEPAWNILQFTGGYVIEKLQPKTLQ